MYSKHFRTDIHDIDYRGRTKISALMRFLQSAAESQLSENGMSYDELKSMNRAFILSRLTLKVYREVGLNDDLEVFTYPNESKGFTFNRCYHITSGGEVVARASSAWALLDTATRGLVRVDGFDLGLELFPPHDVSLKRFIPPKELTEVGRYTVGYGSIDRNMHMNNTVYPDVYQTFMPSESCSISEISINYRSEAKMGEVLTVMRAPCIDGSYYFRTVKPDGTINTEAEIRFFNS